MTQNLNKRRKAYHRGHFGEWLAALYLVFKGYRIIEKRYRTKLGEIDLIAKRGKLVIFVEVKARKQLGAAMDSVSHQAQNRIEAASDIWIARQKSINGLSFRYDIIAIIPWHLPRHIQNAWQGRNL